MSYVFGLTNAIFNENEGVLFFKTEDGDGGILKTKRKKKGMLCFLFDSSPQKVLKEKEG